MIAILCTSRTGSSMVAAVFAAHGVGCGKYAVNRAYPTYENVAFRNYLRRVGAGYRGAMLDFIPDNIGDAPAVVERAGIGLVKCGVEYWPTVQTLNPSVVIKVKRNLMAASRSVADKRGESLDEVLPLIAKRFDLLDQVPGVEVDTDRLVNFDFEQILTAFQIAGIEFSAEKARAAIHPGMWHF